MDFKKDSVLIHGQDLKVLTFHFDKIMSQSESRAVFLKHLATEYNTEPLVFLNEIEKLEKIAFPAQEESAVKLAIDICTTFIINNFDTYEKKGAVAAKQINISADTLALVIDVFKSNEQYKQPKQWVSNKVPTPSAAFARVKDAITVELSSESFPRYVCFSRFFVNCRYQFRHTHYTLFTPAVTTAFYSYTNLFIH